MSVTYYTLIDCVQMYFPALWRAAAGLLCLTHGRCQADPSVSPNYRLPFS